MKHLFKILLLLMLAAVCNYSQDYTAKDVQMCNSKFTFAVNKKLGDKPISDVITEVGKSFMGTDYAASALEKDGDEKLVVNLSGLDCTTFLENVLAFSRLIKKNDTTFPGYLNELTLIRYRDGKIDGYPSRLHYFSDWIYDNSRKGIITDVTQDIGGQPLVLSLNFMSTHPQSYRQLKQNPQFVPVIEKQEKEINSRNYYYVPRERVKDIEDKIQNGDLIAVTTSIKGLDIGHVGIAVKESDGRIHLLHAPQEGSKVQITKDPLAEYLMKVKKHSGIIILRAEEP